MNTPRRHVLEVPRLDLKQTDIGLPLPQFDENYLATLREAGFAALGTVSVILSYDGIEQRMLMLHHREYSNKIQPGGAWGFPAETAKAMRRGGHIRVENTLQTMFRGFKEEIGIELGFPALQARAVGAYTSCAWPRSYYTPGQYAFGVVPVLHLVNHSDASRLVKNYAPQKETDAIAFMTADEIRNMPELALRIGTLGCLDVVQNSPFFAPHGPFTPVFPHPSGTHPGSFDVMLQEIDL